MKVLVYNFLLFLWIKTDQIIVNNNNNSSIIIQNDLTESANRGN